MLKAFKINDIYQLNDFIRTQKLVFITGNEPYTVVIEVDDIKVERYKKDDNVVDFYDYDPA